MDATFSFQLEINCRIQSLHSGKRLFQVDGTSKVSNRTADRVSTNFWLVMNSNNLTFLLKIRKFYLKFPKFPSAAARFSTNFFSAAASCRIFLLSISGRFLYSQVSVKFFPFSPMQVLVFHSRRRPRAFHLPSRQRIYLFHSAQLQQQTRTMYGAVSVY